MITRKTSRFRILALDVDGTLLDGQGMLRPRTIEAVARAARAGIRPVLCTGRRFRRARPVSESLGTDAPLVCNSGALIKDPHDGRTLWRADFDQGLFEEIVAFFREHREPVVGFADREQGDFDFAIEQTETGRPLFDEYVDRNRDYACVDPQWSLRGDPHFHICAIGERSAMQGLEASAVSRFGSRVRTFVQKSPSYSGTMCEILRGDASKWTAILHLAETWDIDPSEICAIGDDLNDLPMIVGSGLGVAMPHSPAEVLEAADHVASGNDEDGVAEFIENVLLAG